MPIKLTQQGADLHVDLALVLEPLQFPGGIRFLHPFNNRARHLGQTGVEADAALLKSSHFLEAKSHVVHSDLNQVTVRGVPLEHEPVE